MVRATITWNWIALTASLRSATKMPAGILPLTVLELLALVFLVVGALTFFRVRQLRRQEAKTTAGTQQNHVQTHVQWQQRLSFVPSLALIVPVILFVCVWLGNTALFNSLTPTPTPIHHPTITPPHSPIPTTIIPGTLTVGTSITFPQQVFLNQQNKLDGFDIGLINAFAQQLKLKIKLQQMKFDQLKTSLNNNSVDVVIAAYPLTSDVASLPNIPYLNPREVVLTLKSAPKLTKFSSLTDLCGHTIGILKASNEDTDLQNAKSKCSHNTTITIIEEQSIDAVSSDLANGIVEATYQDSPSSVSYQKTYPGKFLVVGSMPSTKEGILVSPDNPSLFQTIQSAFALLMQNGQYSQLLTKWNLTDDAIAASGAFAATREQAESSRPA